MILILFLYTVLAATFTIGKVLLSFLPPIFLTALRMTIAGLLLLGFFKIFYTGKKSLKVANLYGLFGLSIIHILIPFSAEFVALQSIAPSCAALMFNLTPFFSALFSYWYFHEVMTMKKYLGFLLGFGAISWFIISQSHTVACDYLMYKAYFLMLMAVVSCSWAWVYFRKLVHDGYDALQINGIAMLVGGLLAFPLSKIAQETVHFAWNSLPEFLLFLSLIILLANVIFYNLYGYLLKKYTATLLSFMGCMTPLLTSFFDYLFLGIPIHLDFFIALLIVSAGIYIFYQEELQQGYVA